MRKTVNGARTQERREAFSTVEENEAVLENARAEMERHNRLFAAGIISGEDNERYAREFQVAKAKFEEARQHHALIDDRHRAHRLIYGNSVRAKNAENGGLVVEMQLASVHAVWTTHNRRLPVLADKS